MKQKTQLFIMMLGLFFCTGTLSAQHSLQKTTTLPRAGDKFIKTEMEFSPIEDTSKDKKEKKEKKTWSFVKLKEKEKKKTYKFTIRDGKEPRDVIVEEITPDYTVTHFEDGKENLVTGENNTLHRRQISDDTLLDLGYETPNSRVCYHNKPILMKFPMKISASYKTTFTGRGTKDDQRATLHTGTVTTTVDEYGELVMPRGNILHSVIRTHETKEENIYYESLTGLFDINAPVNRDSIEKSGEPAEQITTDTYRWYEEGYRYPIFETVQTYRIQKDRLLPLREATYIYAPYEQMFLKEDPENEKIKAAKNQMRSAKEEEQEIEIQPVAYSFYPNPVADILHLKFSTQQGAETLVTLYDLSGREILRKTCPAENGYRNETLSMSACPPGTYILRISCADKYAATQIIKQ